MFCDGKCKITKETEEGTIIKKCGLFVTETLKNDSSGEVKEEEKCIFMAILSSQYRQEQKSNGIHAAINSDRNETIKHFENISNIFYDGFHGLLIEAKNRKQLNFIDEDSKLLGNVNEITS